jgi:hypothetical protein
VDEKGGLRFIDERWKVPFLSQLQSLPCDPTIGNVTTMCDTPRTKIFFQIGKALVTGWRIQFWVQIDLLPLVLGVGIGKEINCNDFTISGGVSLNLITNNAPPGVLNVELVLVSAEQYKWFDEMCDAYEASYDASGGGTTWKFYLRIEHSAC